jgi:type I restriction-modification system DNA methylase subunit
MAGTRSKRSANSNSANIGFEQKLWLAADKLRSNMDAAEYKLVVLGLIFLKYISDSFEEHHGKLLAGEREYAGANPEDPDEYRAEKEKPATFELGRARGWRVCYSRNIERSCARNQRSGSRGL